MNIGHTYSKRPYYPQDGMIPGLNISVGCVFLITKAGDTRNRLIFEIKDLEEGVYLGDSCQ
jgi:hypothetical protein